MAVAIEYIDAFLQGAFRPSDTHGCRQPAKPTSLGLFREAVTSGLLEMLDIEPQESRLDIASAGRSAVPVNAADVVLAGPEMLHQAGPAEVAAELLRACRPGGRIGIASPAPGSFLAAIHARIEAYKPPAGGDRGRGFGGTREDLDAVFGASAVALGARDRSVTLSISSAEHWLAEWRTSYAPLRDAYARIDPEWHGQFTSDLLHSVALFAEPHAGKLQVRIDYLEFFVHKGHLQ